MAGTPGRSGGKNRKVKPGTSDGKPTSPRPLSPVAARHFKWIIARLNATGKNSTWCRIDGVTIATLAELLESQERVSTMLAQMPESLEIHRMRNTLTASITRMSGLVGLSPIDRARLPAELPNDGEDDAFRSIMRRMSGAN
jgi:hypothetical protein